MWRKILFAILLCLLVLPTVSVITTYAQEPKPLNVILIWHFHQPFYYDPNKGTYILPWVRMHSVANYYKMARIVSNYSDIKVTFTFTGSLLVQLKDYVENNATDLREEISLKIANGQNLTIDEKFSMLEVPGGFFDINWVRIIAKYTRYRFLKQKRDGLFNTYGNLPPEQMKEEITSRFTDQDYLDLAMLFNLLWIDPEIANADPELAPLVARAKTSTPEYTREELALVLQKHRELMSLVLPTHKQLFENNQTEVVPSPYTHPLMPLLVDFGWEEDLDAQIKKGIELFESVFGKSPKGMWSPEMAINEESLRIMAENDIIWTAADQNILELAGIDVSVPENLYSCYKLDFGEKSLYVFFRDTQLSNNIGFVYAGWTTDQAIQDFTNKILNIQQYNTDGNMVVTIALDGENPWESYPNNGNDFLNALYEKLTELQDQGKIVTTTPYEYVKTHTIEKSIPKTSQQVLNLRETDISNIKKYEDLPFETKMQMIPEGSWSGKDLRLKIWIGDRAENIAYMWLKAARESLMSYVETHPGWNETEDYSEAMDALYRAEASDWCFWYGNDMGSPKTFDPIFKCYLRRIYQIIGLDVPDYLYGKFYPDGEASSVIPLKPSLISPTIDGKIIDEEWQGNETLAIAGEYIDKVLVGYDYNNLYLAIIPPQNVNYTDWFGQQYFIGIYTSSPRISYSPFNLEYNVWARYQSKMNETLGFAIHAETGIWFNETSENNQVCKIYYADGHCGYSLVGEISSVSIDQVIEIMIPFSNITLEGKDDFYLALTVAYNESIVELTAKFDTPAALEVPKQPEIGEIIFYCEDPEGDDYGPGTYVYPTNPVFVEGHLDLLNFTVSKLGNYFMFRFRFKTIGDNPWNGPNGFCLQFIHVYVDTDNVTGSGRTDTFGARVNIRDVDAWEMAFFIGPGWAGSNVITFANDTQITDAMIIELEGEDTIAAKIPINITGDPTDTWKYAVLVMSWDGYAENNIRIVKAGEPEEYVAGGADPDAVIAGVNPYVFDILTPLGMTQTDILSSYSISEGKFAAIYAVSPTQKPEQPPPSEEGLPWEVAAAIVVIVGAAIAAAIIIQRKRKR